MPIVFAQPSPMAPDIAAGGGAADVATHDFAALAGLYEAANRNQLQASQAGAGLALQSSEASARNRTQADIASGQLEHANRAMALAQQSSDRDNYLAQVQAGAAQQHAQLQAWVNQQELSQAEQMELQRNQNAIGTINGMRSRGEITDQTADLMLGEVIPRVSAAKARQQMALAKQEEANARKANEAVITEQAHRQTQQEFAAKYVKNGAMYTDDNDNIIPPDQVDSFQGTKHLHLQNQHGVFTRTNPKTAAAEKPEKPEKPWDAVHEQRQAEVEAEMIVQKANPGLNLKHPETQDEKDMAANVRKTASEIYHERRQDYQSRQSRAPQNEGTQSPPGQTPTTGQPGAAPQAGPPTAQQAAQAAPLPPPADLKPFDWTKPDTMHPVQQQQIGKFTSIRDDIRKRTDLPEKDRWAGEDAATDLKEILGRWGSFQNPKMPETEKKKYQAALRVIAELPKRPPPTWGGNSAAVDALGTPMGGG